MRFFTQTYLALSICLCTPGPIAAAGQPDYSADLTPIILSARSNGGDLTIDGRITIRIVREEGREVLVITGFTIAEADKEQRPLSSPCVATYRYILAADVENLSAKAACPEDALAINPQEKYDEMAMVIAHGAFQLLAERLRVPNGVKERDA